MKRGKRTKKEKIEAKETQMEVQKKKGTGHSVFRAHNMLQRCVQKRRWTLQQRIRSSIKMYFH